MNDDEGVGVCDAMDLVPLPVDSSLAPDVNLNSDVTTANTDCDACSFLCAAWTTIRCFHTYTRSRDPRRTFQDL